MLIVAAQDLPRSILQSIIVRLRIQRLPLGLGASTELLEKELGKWWLTVEE
jgi:hypothetical protein